MNDLYTSQRMGLGLSIHQIPSLNYPETVNLQVGLSLFDLFFYFAFNISSCI